jgi:hypothetical protein
MQDKTQDESNYCSHVKQLFSTAETYFTQNPFRFFRFRGHEPYKIINRLQELHSSNLEADVNSNDLSALVFTPETCDSAQTSYFWNGHFDSLSQASENVSIPIESTSIESEIPPWGPSNFLNFSEVYGQLRTSYQFAAQALLNSVEIETIYSSFIRQKPIPVRRKRVKHTALYRSRRRREYDEDLNDDEYDDDDLDDYEFDDDESDDDESESMNFL